MTVKVRFAPSPTGKLHVGNVRTALMNVLFARSQNGQVLLRIDDTDLERSTKAFEDGIKADLTWLGFAWDETFNQSDRFDKYDAAKAELIEKGLLYPCYETEDELDRKRKIQRAQGKPPVYDRAALSLSDDEKAAFEAEGRKPHWRFKLSGGRIEWNDQVRGPSHIETSSVSDPILIRADGSYLYTLPSVVDDLEANITHIIRGEDHVTNSAAQIEIFEALGGKDAVLSHGCHLMMKGGHGSSDMIVDRLYSAEGLVREREEPKIDTRDTHGTGCTVSSALAFGLGAGLSLAEAFDRAIDFTRNAIEQAPGLGTGSGPLGQQFAGDFQERDR